MNFLLTSLGQSYIRTNNSTPTSCTVVFGNGSNYTAAATDTNIHGTAVYTTTSSDRVPVGTSSVKYLVQVDMSVPTFSFGEIALLYNGTLIALGVSSTLIVKQGPSGNNPGSPLMIEMYIDYSTVDASVPVIVSLRNPSTEYSLQYSASVDSMPSPIGANPSSYFCYSTNSNIEPFLCVSDGNVWIPDGYDILYYSVLLSESAPTSVGLPSDGNLDLTIVSGEYLIRLETGSFVGMLKSVNSVYINGSNQYILNMSTSFSDAPPRVGVDRVSILRKTPKLRLINGVIYRYSYSNLHWYPVGGPTGGGTDSTFYLNDNSVTTSYNIPTGKNAISAGPISVLPGVAVGVPPGSAWTITP
jgi:hypothetical protein